MSERVNSNDAVLRVAQAFQTTIDVVAGALATAWGARQRWGVIGFLEVSLVFLLRESLHAAGWSTKPEPFYPDSHKRGDLDVEMTIDTTFENERLWIEAKRNWRDATIQPQLDSVEKKLRVAPTNARPIAVIFAVDELGCTDETWEWTPTGVLPLLQSQINEQGLEAVWQVRACATAPSPYVGACARSSHPQQRHGLFVAAFIELLRPRPEGEKGIG